MAGSGMPAWVSLSGMGRDSAMASNACGAALVQATHDALARSATVSLVEQKGDALNIAHQEAEVEPNKCPGVSVNGGATKASCRTSSGQTQMRMYASARSTFNMKNKSKAGSDARMCHRRKDRARPNCMASAGA